MIRTKLSSSAGPDTLHRLLVEVDSWPIWSPHVASVEAESTVVHAGWRGNTRAFFSPGATEMVVDEVRPAGGYSWHSSVGPWRLEYDNSLTPAQDGTTAITFAARLHGPLASQIERAVAPLSAFGQRRRMRRLSRLGEFMEQRDSTRRAEGDIITT